MDNIKTLFNIKLQGKAYKRLLFEIVTLVISIAFLYYTSRWFNINIIILNYNIDMKLLIAINLFNFVILKCRQFINKDDNEFYLFLFWTLNIIGIGTLYFSYCFTFLQLEYIPDYLLSFKYLSIEYQYTIVYKTAYFNDYLLFYIEKSRYLEHQKELITKILKTYIIDDKPVISNMTLERIKLYISFLVEITLPVHESTNLSYEYFIFYKYPIHSIVSLITNSGIILMGVIIVFYYTPSFILTKFFYKSVYDFVKNTLLNAKGVTFDMNNEEFHDLCSLFTVKLFENYTTVQILQLIMKNKE